MLPASLGKGLTAMTASQGREGWGSQCNKGGMDSIPSSGKVPLLAVHRTSCGLTTLGVTCPCFYCY